MTSTDGTARIEWVAPVGGHWRRDFRLAEWLPGPVSLSAETWLLPSLDRGFSEASVDEFGSGTKPGVVVVNGWGYSTDPMPTHPLRLLRKGPVRMLRIGSAMARMGTRPELVERYVAAPGLERYRSVELPALEASIVDAEARTATADEGDLVDIVDRLAVGTGRLMLGMVQSMGFSAKVEYAISLFFDKELDGRVSCRPLDLFVGNTVPSPTPAHGVVTLDWREATAGERGSAARPADAAVDALKERRSAAEAECRAALTDASALARFDALLAMLDRWSPIREQLAGEFTLAWPAMRTALGRLGSLLVERGVIIAADDVYELSLEEIRSLAADHAGSERGGATLAGVVEQRRALRRERSGYQPPLTIGEPIRQWKKADSIAALFRSDPPAEWRVIVTGIGSSPGRATGPARVVTGPEDFHLVEPDEILVAPSTAPGWTPLFAIVAGIVTDAGGPFAHTSIVAREFGIPAVVTATGATNLIRTGDTITVDAASGTVSAS